MKTYKTTIIRHIDDDTQEYVYLGHCSSQQVHMLVDSLELNHQVNVELIKDTLCYIKVGKEYYADTRTVA